MMTFFSAGGVSFGYATERRRKDTTTLIARLARGQSKNPHILQQLQDTGCLDLNLNLKTTSSDFSRKRTNS